MHDSFRATPQRLSYASRWWQVTSNIPQWTLRRWSPAVFIGEKPSWKAIKNWKDGGQIVLCTYLHLWIINLVTSYIKDTCTVYDISWIDVHRIYMKLSAITLEIPGRRVDWLMLNFERTSPGGTSGTTVDGSEIPNNHLGCKKKTS